jgi:hypothetical protein
MGAATAYLAASDEVLQLDKKQILFRLRAATPDHILYGEVEIERPAKFGFASGRTLEFVLADVASASFDESSGDVLLQFDPNRLQVGAMLIVEDEV